MEPLERRYSSSKNLIPPTNFQTFEELKKWKNI